MDKRPITIQSYFPTGDTRGYRIAEVTNTIIEALLIPRKELARVLEERDELKTSGLYFLFGKENAENQNAIECYIGESEELHKRLDHHNKNKDFWEVAIVFISSNSRWPLNKADIKYMELMAYNMSTETQRYYINQTTPANACVTEARENDLEELMHTIDMLLNALGYPVFTKLIESTESTIENNDIFYLSQRNSNARGMYTNEGFVVLQGSRLSPDNPHSTFSRAHILEELHNKNILDENGIFLEDQLFSSPSAAAGTILKGSYNGWDVWKNNRNQSLNEVYRSTISNE